MRGRAAAGRDAHFHVDGDDPFSFPARSRSQSPSRAAVPDATEDREALRALFECTRGGSWRTSLGWPSWGGVRRTSRNPFGEANVVDNTERKPATATAAAAAGTGSGCSSPQRTRGGGSPGNPFAPAVVHNGNPFAPPTPTTRASPSKPSASRPTGAAANTPSAIETLVPPSACHALPIDTPIAMRMATDQPPSPPSRGVSPLATAADARNVQCRHRSPSSPADAQTRSALSGSPQQRDSRSLEARAAWFGVSLGIAGRVSELKLVDNGLVGTLPNALGGLEMLRYLHLGRNALSGGTSQRFLVVFT